MGAFIVATGVTGHTAASLAGVVMAVLVGAVRNNQDMIESQIMVERALYDVLGVNDADGADVLSALVVAVFSPVLYYLTVNSLTGGGDGRLPSAATVRRQSQSLWKLILARDTWLWRRLLVSLGVQLP